PKASSLTQRVRLQISHPTGVHLQLLTGRTVCDRNGRGGATEAELGDSEPMESRVRNLYALAQQELAQLRQPQSLCEQLFDPIAMRLAALPRIPAGAPGL